MRNFFDPENFERLRQIQYLRNGRRLLHVPAAEGVRQAGELSAQAQAFTAAADRQDLTFPFDCRILKAQIETAAPKRIAQPPFFIRTQNDKWDSSSLNGSQFGNRNLPRTQNLEQQGFDVVIDLVEFVDQKHARPMVITERSQEWAFVKEIQGVQAVADLTPLLMQVVGLGFQKELLQRLIESADDLFFRDSHVALKP